MKRKIIGVVIVLLLISIGLYFLFVDKVDLIEYKGDKYIYLEPDTGTFIYNFNAQRELDVDEVHDVSTNEWNFIYFEGDLFVLKKQYKKARKYYNDEGNYEYKFIYDEIGEYVVNISSKELEYLYNINDQERDIAISFAEIEQMGGINRISKDGVFTGTISLAFYKGNWYYRTEVMSDDDKEYMIKLPDTLNKKINNVIGE